MKERMASLNPLTRELVFKLVFYGPGLGGKTTSLQYIHATSNPDNRGSMVSLATPTDRTIYFDFLPLRVQKIRDLGIRLQLFTVPGQVYYAATRKLVLTGADGVVFVADTQRPRLEGNAEALEDLERNLLEQGKKLESFPLVFMWNKQDLPTAVPIDELEARFNPRKVPSFSSVATKGKGVFDALDEITRMSLRAYMKEIPKPTAAQAPEPVMEASSLNAAIASLAETISITRPEESTRAAVVSMIPAQMERPRVTTPAASGIPGAPKFEIPKPRRTPVPPPTTTAEAAGDAARRTLAPMVPEQSVDWSGLFVGSERESVGNIERALLSNDAARAVYLIDEGFSRLVARVEDELGEPLGGRAGTLPEVLRIDAQRLARFRKRLRLSLTNGAVSMRDAVDLFLTYTFVAREAAEWIETLR
ncbi:MAG: hypothetical protein KBF88_03770 [Polyangiaceae bacterium]|nr:hypothetical protein [Polyangiaceae bacterium]